MGLSVICNTSGMPLFHSSTVMFIFYNAEGTQRAHRMCNSKKKIILNTVRIGSGMN